MKDFFKFLEELREDVTHRQMQRQVKYTSTPGRPGKRVSMPTRELLMNLSSYENRAEAAKARAKFSMAKEVWDTTLHTMNTRMYVRELRSEGGYNYYFSFDDEIPYMLAVSKKKIPQKDYMYLGDEYEYMTFYEFGKNFVDPNKMGSAGGGSKPKMYDKYSKIVGKERNINDYVGPMQNAAYGSISKMFDPPTADKFKYLIRSHWDEEELGQEYPDFVKKNGQFDYQKFLRDDDGEEVYSNLVNDETWDTYNKYGIDELSELVDYKGKNRVVLFEFEEDTNDPSLWFLVNKYSDEELKCLSGVDPSSIDEDEMAKTIDFMVANGELKI